MKKTKTKKKKVHKDLRPKTPNLPEKEESSFRNEYAADKILPRLKYKELKEACILRGMQPSEVVRADHHKLASFFVENYEKGVDPNLLVEFDSYVEDELIKKGYKKDDIMLSPSLRMSYVGNIEEARNIRIVEQKESPKIKNKEPEKPKEKRVKDETTGVMKGTKKNMVFELAQKKVKLDKVIEQVKKAFPDANEKSIGIWYKKAKNAIK